MKKSIFILASAVLAFTACNKSVLNAPAEVGVGYLNFAMSSDDVVVSTKTVSGEELKQYDVTLVGQWTKKYSEIMGQTFTLTTGEYNVSAENISETLAETDNGQLRIATPAAQSISVAANSTATAILECRVQSSKFSVKFTEAFKSVFDDYTFVVEKTDGTTRMDGKKTLTLEEETPVFYNGSVRLTWRLTGNHKELGQKTYSNEINLEKAHSLVMTVDQSTESGGLGITITADDSLTDDQQSVVIDPYKNN